MAYLSHFRRCLVTCKGIIRTISTQYAGPQLPDCNFVPKVYKEISYDDNLKILSNNVKGHMLYFKKPLLITQGHMQWVFDETGKRYLDMFAGIVTTSVGHCHPMLVEAVLEQVQTLWHTTNIYLHPKICLYAEKLTQHLPGNLKVCYFVNSGSEANDLAGSMARIYTGNFDIISLRNSYHGGSPFSTALTGNSKWKHNYANGFGVHHAMNPNVYSGIWGGSHCRDSPIQTTRKCSCNPQVCEATENYVKQFEEVLQYSVPNEGKLAAFIAEPIQGVGGIVQYPKTYLKKVCDIVKKKGGLIIADEVQTGFGRTGEHFWGFQMDELKPDIVTMAKGIANGFPMGAVVTTPEIAKSFETALFLNTYAGNPMACVAATKVLDIIHEENLQANSLAVGTYLMQELAKLRDQFDIVGDVRGKGLIIGIEFVKNKESREPLPANEAATILENCKDMGLLLGRGGYFGNVFRIEPPMCITKDDAKFTAEVIEAALTNYIQGKLV